MCQKQRSLSAVVVHVLVKGIAERTELFASGLVHANFACNVTEHHFWLELAFAALSVVGGVLEADQGAAAASTLYGPMYALLVYMWHGNLAETTLPEAVKQMYMFVGIGLVRYGLVKEGEFDKLAVRLFTDYRSIPCTLFVLNFLYLLICKMRMSPISAWSFSMDSWYHSSWQSRPPSAKVSASSMNRPNIGKCCSAGPSTMATNSSKPS